MTVVVPPSLRRFVDGRSELSVVADTVRQTLEAFAACKDGLRAQLVDEAGHLHRFVRVFVDGRPAAIGAGNDEPVVDGAQVRILLALAGG